MLGEVERIPVGPRGRNRICARLSGIQAAGYTEVPLPEVPTGLFALIPQIRSDILLYAMLE
jgi:hypothetical protein